MKQWPFLLIIFLSLPHITFSHEIKLSEFDQSHLSALISRLPTVLIYTHTEKIKIPVDGKKVITSLRPFDTGLTFKCWNDFYNESPWPSFGGCQVLIDLTHPTTQLNHDVITIFIHDQYLAQSLFHAIPYGKPKKEFFSFERDSGTDSSGAKSNNIFHFYFSCTQQECEILLSSKNILSKNLML
jgi:hypothetical protein